MKNLFLLFILLTFCSGKCYSRIDPYRSDSMIQKDTGDISKIGHTKSKKGAPNESSGAPQITMGKKDNSVPAKKDSNETTKTVSPGAGNVKDSTKTPCQCLIKNNDVQRGEWWLIFTPIILFLILIILLLLTKELRNFDFKGALAENEIPKCTIENPEYKNIVNQIGSLLDKTNVASNLNEIVPPTIDISIYSGADKDKVFKDYRPSISRYIAFFSGMLTVIIAVCMTSFYIYFYIHTSCPPDLGALSTVLIALGIGVTPYAVNKVSTAIASNKSE